jgi:hypothetical protein
LKNDDEFFKNRISNQIGEERWKGQKVQKASQVCNRWENWIQNVEIRHFQRLIILFNSPTITILKNFWKFWPFFAIVTCFISYLRSCFWTFWFLEFLSFSQFWKRKSRSSYQMINHDECLKFLFLIWVLSSINKLIRRELFWYLKHNLSRGQFFAWKINCFIWKRISQKKWLKMQLLMMKFASSSQKWFFKNERSLCWNFDFNWIIRSNLFVHQKHNGEFDLKILK